MSFQLDCDYQASKTLNGLLSLFIAFLIVRMLIISKLVLLIV